MPISKHALIISWGWGGTGVLATLAWSIESGLICLVASQVSVFAHFILKELERR